MFRDVFPILWLSVMIEKSLEWLEWNWAKYDLYAENKKNQKARRKLLRENMVLKEKVKENALEIKPEILRG